MSGKKTQMLLEGESAFRLSIYSSQKSIQPVITAIEKSDEQYHIFKPKY